MECPDCGADEVTADIEYGYDGYGDTFEGYSGCCLACIRADPFSFREGPVHLNFDEAKRLFILGARDE